jgi:hypothetical protein
MNAHVVDRADSSSDHTAGEGDRIFGSDRPSREPVPRKFGQLPNLLVTSAFDEPLPESELARWETRARHLAPPGACRLHRRRHSHTER